MTKVGTSSSLSLEQNFVLKDFCFEGVHCIHYILYVHNNIHLCAIRIRTSLSSVRAPTFKYSRTWSNWPLLSRHLFRYHTSSRVISLRGVHALELSKNENLIWGSSDTLLLSVKLPSWSDFMVSKRYMVLCELLLCKGNKISGEITLNWQTQVYHNS